MSKKNTNTELKLSGRGKARSPTSLTSLNFPYFYPTLALGVAVAMLADSGGAGAVLNIRLYLRDRTRNAIRAPIQVSCIENVTSVAVNGTCVKLTPDPAAPAPHAFRVMSQSDGLVSIDVTYAAVGAKVVTVQHPYDPSILIQSTITLV